MKQQAIPVRTVCFQQGRGGSTWMLFKAGDRVAARWEGLDHQGSTLRRCLIPWIQAWVDDGRVPATTPDGGMVEPFIRTNTTSI